mmetsp:Transcript_11329/g.28701  ORF Transcript_11329/g.28701 Transcript_11329/m.28701 type:complete len:388 (+) Transcript_11329:669-1832(+)
MQLLAPRCLVSLCWHHRLDRRLGDAYGERVERVEVLGDEAAEHAPAVAQRRGAGLVGERVELENLAHEQPGSLADVGRRWRGARTEHMRNKQICDRFLQSAKLSLERGVRLSRRRRGRCERGQLTSELRHRASGRLGLELRLRLRLARARIVGLRRLATGFGARLAASAGAARARRLRLLLARDGIGDGRGDRGASEVLVERLFMLLLLAYVLCRAREGVLVERSGLLLRLAHVLCRARQGVLVKRLDLLLLVAYDLGARQALLAERLGLLLLRVHELGARQAVLTERLGLLLVHGRGRSELLAVCVMLLAHERGTGELLTDRLRLGEMRLGMRAVGRRLELVRVDRRHRVDVARLLLLHGQLRKGRQLVRAGRLHRIDVARLLLLH